MRQKNYWKTEMYEQLSVEKKSMCEVCPKISKRKAKKQ